MLRIQNFGKTDNFEAEFSPGKNFIDSKNFNEIVCALKFILNFTLSKQEKTMLNSSSLLYAEVECDALFCVNLYLKRRRPCFEVTKQEETGDFSNEYLSMVTLSHEEQELHIFCKSNIDEYPNKFVRYKNTHTYYKNFSKATDGVGNTRVFRCSLDEYINNYIADNHRILNDYTITLNTQREYVVKNNNNVIDAKKQLTNREYMLYSYACFLQTADFWYEIRKMRDMHYTASPVIIQDVFDYENSKKDAEYMACMAEKYDHQVFAFVN